MAGVREWAERQKSPATILLIASLVVSSLIFWIGKTKGIDQFMVGADSPSRPWTFITYPWAYMPLADGLALMFFFFLLMWLWWLGRDLESEMGSLRFIGLWFAMTFLGGLLMWIGYRITGYSGLLGAPYIPEAALTVAWCARHPTQSVMLYGVLPVQGKWLGISTAVIMVLLYGFPLPLLGVMAILNEGVSLLWALDRIPFLPFSGGSVWSRKVKEAPAARGGRVYDEGYYSEVRRREQEREEKERLRRLLGEPPDEDPPAAKR